MNNSKENLKKLIYRLSTGAIGLVSLSLILNYYGEWENYNWVIYILVLYAVVPIYKFFVSSKKVIKNNALKSLIYQLLTGIIGLIITAIAMIKFGVWEKYGYIIFLSLLWVIPLIYKYIKESRGNVNNV